MGCEGQCGEQGTQTRTRACDNGNCANATAQSVEIKAGCIATATCTGCYSMFITIDWFKSYYISNLLQKNIRNYFRYNERWCPMQHSISRKEE